MIEHYNAFISYKHAPLDTRVASEIQTRLERFRIPKAIQKSSGIKKIDRIFRDKEELLITTMSKKAEPMKFGYYEIYNYKQLIEMAKEQLEGMTLSEEMRNKYGIT